MHQTEVPLQHAGFTLTNSARAAITQKSRIPDSLYHPTQLQRTSSMMFFSSTPKELQQ